MKHRGCPKNISLYFFLLAAEIFNATPSHAYKFSDLFRSKKTTQEKNPSLTNSASTEGRIELSPALNSRNSIFGNFTGLLPKEYTELPSNSLRLDQQQIYPLEDTPVPPPSSYRTMSYYTSYTSTYHHKAVRKWFAHYPSKSQIPTEHNDRVLGDFIVHSWFENYLGQKNDILFLTGSSKSQEVDDNFYEVIFSVAKRFNHTLVYDLDSSVTVWLEKRIAFLNQEIEKSIDSSYRINLEETRAFFLSSIGISSSWERTQTAPTFAVAIENDFLRFQAIASLSQLYSTPGSLVGLALLLDQNSRSKMTVSNFSGTWADHLPNWSMKQNYTSHYHYVPGLGFKITEAAPSLGLSSYGAVQSVLNAEAIIRRFESASSRWENISLIAIPQTDNENKIKTEDNLPYSKTFTSELMEGRAPDIVTTAEHWLSKQIQIAAAEEKFGRSRRKAVFFGSKGLHLCYANLIADAVMALKRNGFTHVYTGGGGGLMDLMNNAAYEEGLISAGIPLGGYREECTKASRYQHYTISTNSYAERIPFLLENKEVVLVGPGGDGTIKELVTTLFKMASDQEMAPTVYFISSTYYHVLHNWIQSLPLDPEILEKFILFDEENTHSSNT